MARDTISRAVSALFLYEGSKVDGLAHELETEVVPAIASLPARYEERRS